MTPTETLQQLIARNVRDYRHARGLTLDALAAAAEVSRRMVVLIERGATNPSVGTLDRLADALGVGFPALVGFSSPTGAVEVIAPEAMPVIWRGADPGSTARLTVPLGPLGGVEVWEWHLAPRETFAAEADPPGTQKLLYVLAGVLTLRLDDTTLRVPTGHGARLPADRPHGYENHDDSPLHFIGTVVMGAAVRAGT